jgi:hypothetical protein
MKKIFSILFIIGMFASLACASVEGLVASGAGYILTQASVKLQPFAFLMIVPMKYVTALGEEVPYASRAEKALYDNLITLNRSNQVTLAAIEAGAISYDPISYYMRAVITGLSGKQRIISAQTLNTLGVTNLPNGAVLPQYYNFCFDRIAIRYAVANSANALPQSITGWSSVRGTMPAALANGEVIISINRNTVVETPISDFTSVAAITAGGERDFDGGVLEKPRFFLEQLSIETELNLASGQSIPSAANNTYAVEIMFYGVQARLKI